MIAVDPMIGRLAKAPHLLVALDFDGTLSPLVDEPISARMAPGSRLAVDALLAAPATTVALVSGRSLADLRVIAEHTDASPLWLAGSHGAERWIPGEGPEAEDPDEDALRDSALAQAEEAVAGLEGVWIEPKRFGLAVHTRLADAHAAAVAGESIDGLIAELAPGWRRRTGFNIVEYASRHEGKDAAVAAMRARIPGAAVLFAGDDVTDEDALRSLKPGDVGIRVGEGETSATLRVSGIAELAEVLTALAHARQAARE